MNNKYYQPELEELYIGYEFEYRQNLATYIYNEDGHIDKVMAWDKNVNEINNNNTWIKDKVLKEDLIDDTSKNRSFGHNDYFNVYSFPIRTKYLDIEDIESLGFIKSSMQFRKKDLENYIVGFSNRFDNDLIHVYIDKKYNNIKIVKEEIVLKDGFEELEYETLFKGSCKSINELKLILKMIGYE